MPSYRNAFPSKWLKAADCHPPISVEIRNADYEDVGSGTDIKRKLVLRFVGREQGFVLNITNGNTIEALLGTDDTDDWIGRRICLFSTKVQFKDKLVDAIRVRAVPTRKPQPPVAPPKAAAPTPAEADDAGPGEQDEPDPDVGF
jgi:hypothetical protein